MSWSLGFRTKATLRVLTLGAWELWVTLSVLVFLLYAPAFWARCGNFQIAAAGLQIAGLVLVALGIRDTRKRFNRPSLQQSVKTWLAELKNAALSRPAPAGGRARLEFAGSGALGLEDFRATVSATTEQRLAALEAEVASLGRRLSQFMTDSARITEVLRESLDQETKAREQGDTQLGSLIEEQSAGGLHLEMMGAFWIFAGVLADAFPSVLARVLPWFPC